MIPHEELRQALLTERRRVLERVVRVEEDLRWLDANVEPEIEEEGQEQAMSRLLARLDEHGLAEIGAIDRALSRLASGGYGHCEVCRDRIPLERLRALPSATTCAPCAAGAERKAV
jgi:RNA polymerase-binding transcription factor DksA